MQNGQNLTKRAKTCRMRKNVAYKTKKIQGKKILPGMAPTASECFCQVKVQENIYEVPRPEQNHFMR